MPKPVPEVQFQVPQPLQNLFMQAEAWPTPNYQPSIVKKGSIVVFNYVGQTNHRIHDPYPLAIVSDIFTDKIRGVNLHYLTLPTVRNIIMQFANKDFSYRYIKDNSYIVSAFRSYKRTGISQLKMLDATFLHNILNVVRAIDPNEVELIRRQIHELMIQPNQPKAEPTEEQPV